MTETADPTFASGADHGASTPTRAAWRRARRSTSSSTSTTRSRPARSASTSRSRSASRRSTRRSARASAPASCMLIGGAQGTGKTTMALQMARNVASGGQANVLYICFEHDEQYLLNRLIAMESALAHLPHKTGAIKIQDVRKEILGHVDGRGRRRAPSSPSNPRLRPSLDRIARYGQNLFLLRGSQTATHRRQHPQARPAAHASCRATAGSSSSSTTSRRCRSDPGAADRDREGHVRRQRPQGHRAVRGGPDDQRSSPPTRRASRRRACGTTTCAARRRSTTRPTSS